jgi:hypothetical protein
MGKEIGAGATGRRRPGLEAGDALEARKDFPVSASLRRRWDFFHGSAETAQLEGLDSRGTIVLRQGRTLVYWNIYVERR